MKAISIIIFIFAPFSSFAQNEHIVIIDSLTKEVHRIDSVNTIQNKTITNLNVQLRKTSAKIDSLQAEVENQKATIAKIVDSLGIKISENTQHTNKQINGVNESIGNKTLYGIIVGAILLLFSVVLFEYLRRKQKSNKTDIEARLIKEYSKQAEAMESLLKTLRELPVTAIGGEPDHSLALKLADEITLMERNISLMDGHTKGLKQLNHSIGKLKDNLAANGYEIPELLGKPYNEGMKAIITNTIQDENLEKGMDLITKIVKPQVNYQDKMIQAAQIEVSIN
jgi:tetrahydromethanopterin S-methyltransferase subunit G